jgi:hypothetical protein
MRERYLDIGLSEASEVGKVKRQRAEHFGGCFSRPARRDGNRFAAIALPVVRARDPSARSDERSAIPPVTLSAP